MNTETPTSIDATLEKDFASYPQSDLNSAWEKAIYPDHGWGGQHGDMTDLAFRRKFEEADAIAEATLQDHLRKITGYIGFKKKGRSVVVFNPLGRTELRSILGLELAAMQARIASTSASSDLVCCVNDAAREFLLREGADARYGARHLKRAVERLVVHPVSNLIASGQLQNGDRLTVDFDHERNRLVFSKDYTEPSALSVGSSAAA